MDYHLKATTEDALWTALIETGVVELVERQIPSEGAEIMTETIRQPKVGQNLDVIGVIWKPTGKTLTVKSVNDTDMAVPEMAAIDGYHANLRGGLTDAQIATLGDMIITAPATPYRVWA